MSYDNWKADAPDPGRVDGPGDVIDALQNVVYVTCKECRHQIEAGEDCPYCEKSADTGRLDTPDYGDDL